MNNRDEIVTKIKRIVTMFKYYNDSQLRYRDYAYHAIQKLIGQHIPESLAPVIITSMGLHVQSHLLMSYPKIDNRQINKAITSFIYLHQRLGNAPRIH